MVAYEKTDEIREPLIWNTLDIQEELNVRSLHLRQCLDVDFAGPDCERLYLKIEGRRPPQPSPISPRFIQEGKLVNCKNPFTAVTPIAFGVIRFNKLRSSSASALSTQAVLNGQYGQCLLRTTGGGWADEPADQPLMRSTIEMTVLDKA